MNIVQILPALDSGGVETGTVDLARALVQKGHRAVVISGGGRLVAQLEKSGVKHYALPVHRKNPWSIFTQVRKVARILRDERADLVHARSRVPGWIAYFASRMAGVRFVTTCHGWYNARGFSTCMAWGARVIVASSSIGRHMTEDFGVPVENIRLIPRGVDLKGFTWRGPRIPNPHGPVVGVIGRITPLKGHEVLIRALGLIARKMPGLQVKIVGTAPRGKEKYERGLRDLAARLGLGPLVKFLGDRDDVPRILEGLDALVVPTKVPEAFGRVVIEAQAVGVPVIASRVGGLAEIIEDGRTGLLVSPEDPEELAKRIQELVSDPELIRIIVTAARKKVETEYTLDLMVDRTLEVYEEVLGGETIALFKMSALGDVILATPSIRMLRTQYPKARLVLVTEPGYGSLFSACPYLDEVMTFDKKRRGRSLKALGSFSEELRKRHIDMSVDLQNNTLTHVLAFLSGAPKRYGYRRKVTGRLLNKGIGGFKRVLPPVDHQFEVLRAAGVETLDPRLELWTRPEDGSAIDRFLEGEWTGKDPVLIGVHIGASGRWASKRWPAEYFAELGDLVANRLGARVVLTGDRSEMGEAQKLALKMKTKPIIAVGKTHLTELVELIRRFHVFVCGDSAPLHVAATVGTPLVALFGPTDPKRHMPPGDGHRVLYTGIECSPCYQTVCPKKHHKCLRDIMPEQVLRVVEELLTRKGKIRNSNLEIRNKSEIRNTK
ncbi:MAG: lipopolysaccharide heptosyltransferase II [Candidatus Omnitrophica bacterium]|nr:lipopolysaccharide heptosyltransferase II [Candidatus Omnitrophota bacterium]